MTKVTIVYLLLELRVSSKEPRVESESITLITLSRPMTPAASYRMEVIRGFKLAYDDTTQFKFDT